MSEQVQVTAPQATEAQPAGQDIFKSTQNAIAFEEASTEQAAGEAQPAQEQKVEEVKTEETDQRLSKSWRAIAKQEKDLREKSNAFKREKEELMKLKSEIEEIKNLVSSDPTKYLEKQLGSNWIDQVAKQAAGIKEDPAVVALKKAEALEKMLIDERNQAAKAQKEQAVQSAITNYRKTLVDTVKAKSDGFELLSNLPEYENELYSIAEQIYTETGEIPQPENVAQILEDSIFSNFELLLKTNKARNKISEIYGVKLSNTNPQDQTPQNVKKSISQKLGTKTKPASEDDKPLSDAERRARAIALLEMVPD